MTVNEKHERENWKSRVSMEITIQKWDFSRTNR